MANDIELVVPTLTTPGPDYATQVSDDLTTIATHDHDGVNNGTTIDIAAQDCNEDLSLDHHNLSNVRSVEFDNQPAALTGSQDVNCIYVNQGNFGFNNSDGIFVQLTNGNNPSGGGSTTFTNWTPRSTNVSSNFSILSTDTYNLINLNSFGGSFTGTLPIAAAITPTPQYRLYLFRDVSGTCGTHPVTIQVTPASGNAFSPGGNTSITLNQNGAYVAIFTDGVTEWFVWSQNVYNDEDVSFNNTAITMAGGSIAAAAVTDVRTGGGIAFSTGAGCVIENASFLAIGDTSICQFNGTSSCNFASGTSLLLASGAILTAASGSTVTCNGTTNLGATNISGATALNGPITINTTVAGTATLTGTINGTGAATINLASTSAQISNTGSTSLFGVNNVVVVLNQATAPIYTLDLGGFLDNVIYINPSAASTIEIILPPTPQTGRTVTIMGGYLASAAAQTVFGNGNTVQGVSTFTITPASYSGQALSAIGTYSVTIIFLPSGWEIVHALHVDT